MTRYEIVWKVLTLPCSEAARISSEGLDRPLLAHERLAVRLHSVGCSSCRQYRRQIVVLRQISGRLADRVDSPVPGLPDDVRERIKRSLQDD